MAGTGDSLDVVVTCYRLDYRIWPPHWGAKNFFFLYLSAPAVGPTHPCLLWEMAHFHGNTVVGALRPITHPTLVLILRISRAITMLLLYANFVMLWSDLYLLYIRGLII